MKYFDLLRSPQFNKGLIFKDIFQILLIDTGEFESDADFVLKTLNLLPQKQPLGADSQIIRKIRTKKDPLKTIPKIAERQEFQTRT